MISKELLVAYEIIVGCNYETPTDADTLFAKVSGITTLTTYKKIRAYVTRIGLLRADKHKGFLRTRPCTLYNLYRCLGNDDLEGNLHKTQWIIRQALEGVQI